MEKRLLEEIKRFKMMINYDTKNPDFSNLIIKEAVQFDRQDRYFIIVKKGRKEKPKLITLGIAYTDSDKFILTDFGKDFFNIQSKGNEVVWSQLKNGDIFKNNRNLEIDYPGRIFADFEIEEVIIDLVDYNNNYYDSMKERKEQVSGSDWNYTSAGTILLDRGNSAKFANAIKVKVEGHPFYTKFNILEGNVSVAITEVNTEPKEIVTETLDKFEVNGTTDVYCDNMIKPRMSEPEVKKEFDDIIEKIKKYVGLPDDKNGVSAKSKLEKANVTIEGQADSGTPGWLPGSPCTGELDHNYGGMVPKKKKFRTEQENRAMNSFLALNRAKEYGKWISDEIKKQLGINLNITYTFKEYWGESNKRGFQWRSIKINFNTPPHEYVKGTQIQTTGEKLKKLYREKGYKWVYGYFNTINGIKKLDCLEKLGNNTDWGKLWCANENRLVPTNDSKRGVVTDLCEKTYSIKAQMDGWDLILSTSKGDLTLKGGRALSTDAAFMLQQGAMGQSWDVCGQNLDNLIQFPEMENVGDNIKIEKGTYSVYDPKKYITIDGVNFFESEALGFVLVPQSCAGRPEIQGQNIMSDEEIEMEFHSNMSPPPFSPKQLNYLVKQLDSTVYKKVKNLKIKGDREGEAIQDDPNMIRRRRD